jgi:hypothetical protein
MKRMVSREIPVFFIAAMCGVSLPAQAPVQPGGQPAPAYAPAPPPPPSLSTAILEWTPPALAQLTAQAETKESFTLDKTMLAVAAGLLPDSDADVRQSAAKLDGVSVHLLRFAAPGTADPAAVNAIREAYHLRGWKHLVTTTNTGGPIHDGVTDVWLVLDGSNVRGGVVLVESPKSLTLVTMAGNLSPTDLLRLRGHFGIPRFAGDMLKDAQHN